MKSAIAVPISEALRRLLFSLAVRHFCAAGLAGAHAGRSRRCADLGGLSSIQGLEQYLDSVQIELSFRDGLLFSRMGMLIDGKVPAASLFSGPCYFVEQLGFRKIIDTTFMMASIVNGTPEPEDVRKYFRTLRRAQRDIDLRAELYIHYYRKEFPLRFHNQMDTRGWGPGERLVFEPYSKETFEESFA